MDGSSSLLEGWGGVCGPGPIKIQMWACRCNSLSHDLHLEQSPENRHSSLSQEIRADSDLMGKVNLPNFSAPPPLWKEPR